MTAFTLRELEATLQKVVPVTTEEIETDEGDCKGLFVFRDGDGEKFMWGPTPVRYEFHTVETVAEADHVDFLCPKCFEKNGGAVGTHIVMVTFADRNVPAEAGSRDAGGKPSRWTAKGSTIDDLVLTPSILLNASQKPEVGCHWHGFVGSNGVQPGYAGEPSRQAAPAPPAPLSAHRHVTQPARHPQPKGYAVENVLNPQSQHPRHAPIKRDPRKR